MFRETQHHRLPCTWHFFNLRFQRRWYAAIGTNFYPRVPLHMLEECSDRICYSRRIICLRSRFTAFTIVFRLTVENWSFLCLEIEETRVSKISVKSENKLSCFISTGLILRSMWNDCFFIEIKFIPTVNLSNCTYILEIYSLYSFNIDILI